MDQKLIYGIQQIGVGVDDADAAFKWYANHLGSDVSVFDDSNTATYMAKYMGGEHRRKRAILAMNLQGGSGYELWQYIDRTPARVSPGLRLGDLGINVTLVKSQDIEASYMRMVRQQVEIVHPIQEEPDGKRSFHIRDPYDNIIRIKEFRDWYNKNGNDVGGIFGAALGVSDIEASLRLYRDILNYDSIIYDRSGTFEDLYGLPNGGGQFRRVLLGHSEARRGGFSPLLGESQIELIQMLDAAPKKLFENRYWGDIGFIHICFDIRNMDALVQECADKGFPFQVLSAPSFDMGDANGHWGYIEDPDGTLIEFVETHKVPLIKPLGWNINLQKRDPQKPLPDWLIKALRFKRRKV